MSEYWISALAGLDTGLVAMIEALGGTLWWPTLLALLVPLAIAILARAPAHAIAAFILCVLAICLMRLDETAGGVMLYGASLATALLAIGTGNARRHRAAIAQELATLRHETQAFLTALDQRSRSLDAALAKITAPRKEPAGAAPEAARQAPKEAIKDPSAAEKRSA